MKKWIYRLYTARRAVRHFLHPPRLLIVKWSIWSIVCLSRWLKKEHGRNYKGMADFFFIQKMLPNFYNSNCFRYWIETKNPMKPDTENGIFKFKNHLGFFHWNVRETLKKHVKQGSHLSGSIDFHWLFVDYESGNSRPMLYSFLESERFLAHSDGPISR